MKRLNEIFVEGWANLMRELIWEDDLSGLRMCKKS